MTGVQTCALPIYDATFELMKSIRQICDQIGVKYYLAYGTLLGAVRHSGFIPWDDDVDIWMSREDYNKFFSYMKEHSNEIFPLSFCTRSVDSGYTYGINRITDMRFKYVDNVMGANVDYGIFVDVYPLDFVGNSHQEYMAGYRQIEKLNDIYAVYMQDKSSSKLWHKKLAKKIARFVLHCVYKDNRRMLDYVTGGTNKVIGKYNNTNSTLVGIIVWWAYEQSYPKELFEGETMLMFENEEFRVPLNYKDILTTIYGDYMQLPPEEKRNPYHGYSIYRRCDYEQSKWKEFLW